MSKIEMSVNPVIQNLSSKLVVKEENGSIRFAKVFQSQNYKGFVSLAQEKGAKWLFTINSISTFTDLKFKDPTWWNITDEDVIYVTPLKEIHIKEIPSPIFTTTKKEILNMIENWELYYSELGTVRKSKDNEILEEINQKIRLKVLNKILLKEGKIRCGDDDIRLLASKDAEFYWEEEMPDNLLVEYEINNKGTRTYIWDYKEVSLKLFNE